MRKIIQIAAIPKAEQQSAKIVALCDDGTVWIKALTGDRWEAVPNVPQR
jgi:hypothetical protein